MVPLPIVLSVVIPRHCRRRSTGPILAVHRAVLANRLSVLQQHVGDEEMACLRVGGSGETVSDVEGGGRAAGGGAEIGVEGAVVEHADAHVSAGMC